MKQINLSSDLPRIPILAFETWLETVFRSMDFIAADARTISRVLVHAHCRGIESHGIIRLPEYIKRIRAGLVDPKARPLVSTNGASSPHPKDQGAKEQAIVHVDACGAAGQVAAVTATKAMLDLAEERGMAMAVVKGSSHFGPAGYFAKLCAEREYIAIVLSNAEPCVVPFGGTQSRLGTNPFAFAAPHRDYTILLDMATSLGSMGKIFMAREQGTSIPPEWALDDQGQATQDPTKVAHLRPFGNYKGFALSLVIEILSGIISGAGYGDLVGNMYKEYTRPQNVGHFMWCVKISSLMDINDYYARIANLLSMICEVPLEQGHDTVRIPGQLADQLERERYEHGLPRTSSLMQEIAEIETASGVLFSAAKSAAKG